MHRFWAFLLIAFLAPDIATAQEMRNLSILTGQTGSTYHRFGQDIGRVIRKECGADLQVKSSAGSIENMRRLRHEEFTQLAIVQQDILDYMRIASGDDPDTRSLISRIRYVFPLYAEEVHLVTTKDSGIRSLSDLRDRRVSVGSLESGTFLTSKMILLMTKTTAKEFPIDETTSLNRLLLADGSPDKIDAMFYVVGKPVTLFEGQPSATNRLELVPITEPAVLQKYERTQVTPQDYRWLRRTVETVKVNSVLMTFNYGGLNCENVGMVANRIKANVEELEKFGHGKWQEVNLAAEVPGWSRYSCVDKYLDASISRRGGDQPCRFGPGPKTEPKGPDDPKPSVVPQGDGDGCAEAKKSNNPILKSFCSNFEKLKR